MLPEAPKQYTAEIVRSDGERCTVYADRLKGRQETHSPEGTTKILISRPDKGVAWSLAPETKSYSQIKFTKKMAEGAACFVDSICDWKADGTEIIDGCKCLRFIGTYRSNGKSSGKAHEVRYIDAKTQICRREVIFNFKGKKALVVDCLNVVLGPPPQKLFRIPAGYKRGYRKRT